MGKKRQTFFFLHHYEKQKLNKFTTLRTLFLMLFTKYTLKIELHTDKTLVCLDITNNR